MSDETNQPKSNTVSSSASKTQNLRPMQQSHSQSNRNQENSQIAKKQIRNLELIQKNNSEGQAPSSQQQINNQRTSLRQITSPRNLLGQVLPNSNNGSLLSQKSQNSNNLSKTQTNQAFQFFIPQKVDQYLMSQSDGINRNQSLQGSSKNINIRQSQTSYQSKRTNYQLPNEVLSNENIQDEEEDKKNQITDNNYFISSSIQRFKNSYHNPPTNTFSNSKSNIQNHQNVSNLQENQLLINSPTQLKFNQTFNQQQTSTYRVGFISPTKEDITKRQQLIQENSNNNQFIKQKMKNITQFLQIGAQHANSSQMYSSVNQSAISLKNTTNNNSIINNLKIEVKPNTNLTNSQFNSSSNNSTCFGNKPVEYKRNNIQSEGVQYKIKRSYPSSSQIKFDKPPNIQEFIDRELYKKKKSEASSTSKKNELDQLNGLKQNQLVDEKLNQKINSRITPFVVPQNLNNFEKQEFDKIENVGFINYIRTIFVDCEYMYKDEIQKQLIQLTNLFESEQYQNDSSNQTLDTPKCSSSQQQNNLKQILKTSDFREIKKQVEKLLCVEVVKKKDRKTSELQFLIEQTQSFQDILREGIKRCAEQLNSDCKNLILELVSSVLLLQTKKHMMVEKKKRDDMILFLGGLKDKEKEFKINIFGNEQDVEAFRFKMGELGEENKQLEKQLKQMTEKYNQLNQTFLKQRRVSTIIKNEYLNLRNENNNLNERLSYKQEGQDKKASKTQIFDQTCSSKAIFGFQQSNTLVDAQKSNQNPQQNKRNSIEVNHFLGLELKQTTEKLNENQQKDNPNQILLQIPTSPILKQDKTSPNTQTAKSQSDLKKQIENLQADQQDINEDDEDENDCDIEEILRDVQKITKVENHDVLIKEVKENIPVLFYNQECQTDPKITNPKATMVSSSIQTELQLLDPQLDQILDNERIKQIAQQEELKQQLLNISGISESENVNNISEINNKSVLLGDEVNQSNSHINTKQIFQRVKQRISIVRLIRGLPINKIKKPINKQEIENFTEKIHVLKNFLDSDCPESNDSAEEDQSEEEIEEDEVNLQNSRTKVKINEETPSSNKNITKIALRTQRKSRYFSSVPGGTPINQTRDNSVASSPTKKSQQQQPSTSTQNKTPNNTKSSRQQNLQQDLQISTFARSQNQQEEESSNSQIQINTNESYKGINKKSKIKEANRILRDNKQELKEQILQVVKLYNLESEKSSNYEESIKQLIEIMQELFNFTYKIFNHVQKTQKDSYKSVVEQFFQQFTSIRWRLPKEIDQKFEEDLFPQEALKKKLQMKKQKQQNSKSNALRLNFNTNKVAQKLTVQDKSIHSGVVLTKKVREIGLPKKFNGFLPLKSVLKQITQIYEDRIRQIRESRLSPDTEMCIFVFNKFIHQYGFKNVAEQKYLHFLMNILNYQQIFRVNLFGKLIGVFSRDDENYSIEEMDKYISCWHFLIRGSTMGSAIPFNESDLRIYTHYLRALDLLKVKLEKILPQEQINDLRAFIEQTKEFEAKQTTKLVIDVDQLLSRVLAKYRQTMNSTKVYVKNAFLACDLDGNGSINLNEFLTLFRHIEADKFSFSKAFKMFESNADIITENEKCLSFQKFTALCLQNHLFLDAAQRKFIGVRDNYEIETKFLELKEDWPNEKVIIMNYVESLKPFVQIETYEVWRDVLLVLQDRILKNEKKTKDNNGGGGSAYQSEQKISSINNSLRRINSQENIVSSENIQNEFEFNLIPILIAHKLLKQELKRLIEVGQNEDIQDINSDSNEDEVNEYEIYENDSLQSAQDIQQSDQKNKKNYNTEDDQLSIDTPASFAAKKRQILKQHQHQQNSQANAPKIETSDPQIYQFSEIQVVRESPSSSQQKRMKTNQSNNFNNSSFSRTSTFSMQKQ
ncbi:EF hand protein (macronuclear) [Tetrahymena thermophila SB210]|uniref:EF hand protein n=1 Tax=Tetrahymena thermophila (strain SB210) TaxID=312017 RepID=Q233Z1_TETTS|nr:EF hand protein [Tetrahymena thermophila SB210]EAR92111.2 EF hand protein [Tetrahymena thermophila SB210]|eukprot:XP_001012357.2 EF hand protein [Tetrahymena thermophila SB210]